MLPYESPMNPMESGRDETRTVRPFLNANSENESAMYNVQALPERTNPQATTLNSLALIGESYTVCTVACFQFKPSLNVTIATIESQLIEVTIQMDSPEQMQQEAQDSGYLQIWHEFTWWHP